MLVPTMSWLFAFDEHKLDRCSVNAIEDEDTKISSL